MNPPFTRITICGVGLIGGSLGLATQRAFPDVQITGIDRSRNARSLARRRGAIDRVADDENEALTAAELIILATPVRAVIEWMPRLGACVQPGTIISDVGSTKAEVVAAAARYLPDSVHFIGGHPMAGTERSGPEHADPDLFRNATYVLCPSAPPVNGPLRRLRRWVRALGAHPVVMEAAAHDRLVAYVSHLPQLVSTALADLMANAPDGVVEGPAVELSAGAFRDMTRLAASPYSIWGDIAATNRKHILQAVDEYLRRLQDIRTALARDDLQASFTRANAFYQRYTRRKKTRRS